MANNYSCSRCDRKTYHINFGKLRLKDGTAHQRIRCTVCGRTVSKSSRHPFLKKMKVDPVTFQKALHCYARLGSIRAAAAECDNMRPGTLHQWVVKVREDANSYRSFLKQTLQICDYNQRKEYIKDLFFHLGITK